MRPKEAFDKTMQRVDFLLHLYGLLLDKRRRATRSDWAKRFKKFMRWPSSEKIYRIDGRGGALLILRQQANLTPQQFRHDELSELLRAAIVTSVSALDRYCHEVLVAKIMQKIRRSQRHWPPALKNVKIPLAAVKEVVLKAREKEARPMNVVRRALRKQFHRELTLQRPEAIAKALAMTGIDQLWKNVATEMGGSEKAEEIIRRLQRLVEWRNRIVHEGDLKVHQRGGRVRLNEIRYNEVWREIDWLRKVVDALYKVVQSS